MKDIEPIRISPDSEYDGTTNEERNRTREQRDA